MERHDELEPAQLRVHLTDAAGIEFVDDRAYPTHLGVYWAWGPDDSLWVLDNDVGETLHYTRSTVGWSRREWTPDTDNIQVAEYMCGYVDASSPDRPPEGLRPFYWTKHLSQGFEATLGRPCPRK
jgi:hypothetical protein